MLLDEARARIRPGGCPRCDEVVPPGILAMVNHLRAHWGDEPIESVERLRVLMDGAEDGDGPDARAAGRFHLGTSLVGGPVDECDTDAVGGVGFSGDAAGLQTTGPDASPGAPSRTGPDTGHGRGPLIEPAL